MNEPFILEVTHLNEQLELPAAFQRFGYTYRISVSIGEVVYFFEPDEEGHYRVLGDPACAAVDVALLGVIADKLQTLR